MLLKLLSLILVAVFSQSWGAEYSQKSLWNNVIQMEHIVLSAEYNERRLNVWHENAHGYNRYYVTPLCVLVTESLSCQHQKYAIEEKYVLSFFLKLWDDSASTFVQRELSQIGTPSESFNIVPLPMQEVRISINKNDITSDISVDDEWKSYQSLPNGMRFGINIKNKTLCEEMEKDAKTCPQKFLSDISLHFQFTIHAGQSAARTVNITGQTINNSKFFAHLVNNYSSSDGIVHLKSDDLNKLAHDIYNTLIIHDLSTDGYVFSSSERDQIIKELLDKVKGEQILATELSPKDWESVFWDDIFTRPDLQASHLSDVLTYNSSEQHFIFDQGKQDEFNGKMENKYGKEEYRKRGGKIGVSFFGFGGGGGIAIEDGSRDMNDVTNTTILKNLDVIHKDDLEKFLNINKASVHWTGEKFEPKGLNLYRVNTKAIQSSSQIFYKQVQMSKIETKQEIPIIAESKHGNGCNNKPGDQNHSYTFGGMFQTCQPLDGAPQYQCENFTQYNTFLGGHKCEETFYEPIQVFEHVYFLPDRTAVQERRECIGSQNCTIVPFSVTFKDAVMVKLYWCRLKPHIYLPSKKGAMFGGIFMDGEINDITGKYGCPGTFKPYRIGKSVTACLSYNYAQDFIYSVPIEGFFSCQTSDKTCLNGFTQHHAATENHCDLYYCVKDSQNSFNRIFRRFVNFFTKSFSK